MTTSVISIKTLRGLRRSSARRAVRDRSHSFYAGAAGRMSTEAEELHRIISASVRGMLDAYRIQASAGPVTDKTLEEILFRAAHAVVQSLTPCPVPVGG